MPHDLAPAHKGFVEVRVKLPTPIAEQLDRFAQLFGRPRTRLAADAVISQVFEYQRAEALMLGAVTQEPVEEARPA